MSTKKLTPTQIKKINERIRLLQYKSWDSSTQELQKIRDEIHVLRMKLDEDELLKIKSSKVPPKKPTVKKKNRGLKKPVTKGLTTLCAKTVGVDGRRKKDGTVKKNHVVKKGGKVVAVKKKAASKKK